MEKKSFLLPLRCNYFLQRSAEAGNHQLLVLLLHGHAMTPEEMLRLSTPLVGDGHVLAALQGPYQLWTSPDSTAQSRVAFHWATSFEPEHSRMLHHQMILQVLEEVGIPASRAVLLGFSQSVSLNYRFICTYPGAVRGAIGICGGIPGDWDTASYHKTTTAALHIATRDDLFYSPEVTQRYADRLRPRIADVEYHLLEGGHRIPSAAAPIVQAWLRRVLAPGSAGFQPA